jgi:uncharacterized membrane protein YcjF (UPF0283 family)
MTTLPDELIGSAGLELDARPRSKSARRFLKVKQRADAALIELFRSLFEEIDARGVAAEVAALQRENPRLDPIDHSRLLWRRAAIRCAATGAISGLPSGVFAVATIGADLAYLIYQQFRLILGIATAYGHEPSSRERFQEAVTCIALGSGITLGRHGMFAVLDVAALEAGVIAEKVGARFLADRFGRMIPVVGAVSAGAISYYAIRAVGRATIRYYDSKIDPELAEEIWREGDREHA